MLVQFMLKNVLSFKNETILDMTAVNAYKEHQYNLIDRFEKENFLKVAAIYGANASGKSNLYYAMSYFKNIVAESFNNVDKDGSTAIKKYYIPFFFDADEENSEFEIIEILGDYEYKYGFEYNADAIVSEWMYRKDLNTNRTSTIFERTEDKITLGASVRKECDAYKEQIPAETLALSFFNKLRLKTNAFNELYEGIRDFVVIDTEFCENRDILVGFLPDVIDNDKKKLIAFLAAIDTGIKDIEYEKEGEKTIFFTTHVDKKGQQYKINLLNESAGTIKSIIIFMYAIVVIYSKATLVVDELNAKLHPLLLKYIIDLFHNEESQAQLIYTTHDTTLMDKKFFRRDQIWFVQKDEEGHSELFSLSDFKVRSDASFEKDYLAGVYGGIPLLKEFNMREGE